MDVFEHLDRRAFPTLDERTVFFNAAGGTQPVRWAMNGWNEQILRPNSNRGARTSISREVDRVVESAREHAASLLNAESGKCIVFGASATSLARTVAEVLSEEWSEGDQVIVSQLDHGANRTAWEFYAERSGASVETVGVDPTDGSLLIEDLQNLLRRKRTKLVAVTAASNVVGTRIDVAEIVRLSQAAGAKVVVDAVHAAPHFAIDVQAWGCDFLFVSPYKFFGPHGVSILYGKKEHLEHYHPFKVSDCSYHAPDCWELGTLAFPALNAVCRTIQYVGSLSGLDEKSPLREQIEQGMRNIESHEAGLSMYFLDRVSVLPKVRLFGIKDKAQHERRTPTFALTIQGALPAEIVAILGEHRVFAEGSHFYCVPLMKGLGIDPDTGVLRLSLCHYNSVSEIEKVMALLEKVAV